MASLDISQLAADQQRKIDQTNAEISALEAKLEEEEATLAQLQGFSGQSNFTVQEINYLLQFI